MNWTTLKMKALDALLRWVAGQLWELARDYVARVEDRNDLTGWQKLALARSMLVERATDAGHDLSVGAANFLLEAAVQWMRAKS